MKPGTPDWRALSGLLDRALDLDDGARDAWIDALADAEAAQKPLLRAMFAARSAETAEFIDRLPPFAALESASVEGFRAGAAVGPYRLVRELGRGGMGEVWLAERIDGLIRRPVALKLPLLAHSRAKLGERFAREREILAPLSHPYIARLLDAGFAADGQPYLALEFVEGVPLTRYADARRLDVPARLALFDQVLAAVTHAHESLVLHRDLKPSNILVTEAGEVKLLDFGIAKLMADGQANETALTRVAGAALSLDYAAPEQIAGVPLTTAADVYALGVLLYELLTGTRPYRLKRGTRTELEEAIAAVEPLPPSRARLSDEAAGSRASSVRALRRALAGDLDTIVLKALRKAPVERYPGPRALADDLARYRSGEPVRARPDSLAYRAGKFALRHRAGLAVTALVATLAIGATLVTVHEARVASAEARRAEASRNFLADLFRSAARNSPGGAAAADTTARQLLEQGGRKLLDDPRTDRALELDLLQLLARLNLELDLIEPANRLTAKALSLAREAHGSASVPFARVLMQRAENEFRTGNYTAAIATAREVLAVVERDGNRESDLFAEANLVVGNSLFQLDASKPAEPQRYLSLALEALKQAGATTEERSRAAYLLAWTYEAQRDYGQAEALYRDGIAAGVANFGERSYIVAYGYDGLADMLRTQQRLPEAQEAIRKAIAIYEFALGPKHGTIAFAKTNLAQIEAASGRRAEAVRLADEALALAQDVFGANARQTGYPASYAARLKFNYGDLAGAARAYEQVIGVHTPAEPLSSLPNRATRVELAETLIALGQTARAATLLDESQAGFEAAKDTGSLRAARLTTARGELAAAQGDRNAANARWDQVLHDIEGRPKVGVAAFLPQHAAAVARASPDRAHAEAVLARLRDAGLLPDAPDALAIDLEDRARLTFAIGRLYLAVGRGDEAHAWLEAAVALRERLDAPSSPWLAEARVALADASTPSGSTRVMSGSAAPIRIAK